MRVLLSTIGPRGDVQPLVALAVWLRELGAEAQVCAPLDCAERPTELGVPLVPISRGHAVTGFAQDDTGVDVELSGGPSLRPEYLVGCDGGRSLIR